MSGADEFVPPRLDLGDNIVTPLDFGLKVVETEYGQGVTEVEGSCPIDAPLYEVIAFDPGGTTGWAVFTLYPEAMLQNDIKLMTSIFYWSAGEFTGPRLRQVDAMLALTRAWSDNADLVCEDFILREFATRRELLEPVRVTCAYEARMEAEYPGRDLVLQQPSMAMGTVTDDRMKAAGLYKAVAGMPHARDAVRHALTWARRKKAEIEAEARRVAKAAARGIDLEAAKRAAEAGP